MDLHSSFGSPARRLGPVIASAALLVLPSSALADRFAGTPGDDNIEGTSGPDLIRALAGDDRVRAQAGFDKVFAGDGNDSVEGGNGRDLIRGGDGDDRLIGGEGPDLIFAGRGVDTVEGGPGHDKLWTLARKDVEDRPDATGDKLSGGPGADRFHTRDGERDTIDCGDGFDVVVADRVDQVAGNCERTRRHAPGPRDRMGRHRHHHHHHHHGGKPGRPGAEHGRR